MRAQDELKALNVTLERRVAERSAAAEERARELARSESALQRQKRILQSILDSMSDGVIVADDEGRLILANPAAERLLQLSVADVEEASQLSLSRHGSGRRVTPDPLALSLDTGVRGEEVEGAEVYIAHARDDGGTWLSVNATPLKDEEGVSAQRRCRLPRHHRAEAVGGGAPATRKMRPKRPMWRKADFWRT